MRAMSALNTLSLRAKSVTMYCMDPAHKGHKGYKKADVLAKRGTRETDPERLTSNGKPQAAFTMEIKSNIYTEWQENRLTWKWQITPKVYMVDLIHTRRDMSIN